MGERNHTVRRMHCWWGRDDDLPTGDSRDQLQSRESNAGSRAEGCDNTLARGDEGTIWAMRMLPRQVQASQDDAVEESTMLGEDYM